MSTFTARVDAHEVARFAGRLTRASMRVGASGSAILRKTAFDIESTAKQLAPVDTGLLRSSISTDIGGDGRFGTMTAEIGPTAEYGIYQELGTSRMAAHPYLGPAYDQHIPRYESALARLAGEV